MIVNDGKIVEASEDELYTFWLHHYSDIFDFNFFVRRCEELGTKVTNRLNGRKE